VEQVPSTVSRILARRAGALAGALIVALLVAAPVSASTNTGQPPTGSQSTSTSPWAADGSGTDGAASQPAAGGSQPASTPQPDTLNRPSRHAGARHHRRHRRGRRQTSQQCANANTSAITATNQQMQAAVLCLVNKQRAAHRLPALRESRLLDRSAEGWTVSMVVHDLFSHGQDFAARISAVGFVWSAAGENIATGFSTPADVVKAWMASTDHCQNILDPEYLYVGTGVSRHPVSGWASDPSTWTQDFALPMFASAPSSNWRPSNGCPYS
jgi:uncharacterized protein YkwD